MGTSTKAPIFGISRLRMGTDGNGITTLVAFMGCPLNCKYCLNPQCHEPIYKWNGLALRPGVRMLTPQELYEEVKIDNIYFQTTGGGICFGGGEPGIYADFIREFRKICGGRWKITIETSLANVDIKKLASVIDQWIVDIKSTDTSIYHDYTGVDAPTMDWIDSLKQNVDDEKVMMKVPLIPDYTTEEMVESEIKELHNIGFSNVVRTKYI